MDVTLNLSAQSGIRWKTPDSRTLVTILLVDDDPLQAYVRRSMLERRLAGVVRAADAAEAFILVEQPEFVETLGLIIVGLHMPGIGAPAFVAEITSRLPSIPVLVLGQCGDNADDYVGQNVRFVPRPVTTEEMLAISRQMLDQRLAGAA